MDEDQKYQQIRAEREVGRNYLSTLCTRFNPDLLIGKKFVRGNEYYAEKKKEIDDKESSKKFKSENNK